MSRSATRSTTTVFDRRRAILVPGLLLVLLAAGWYYGHDLGEKSIWMDEASCIIISHGSGGVVDRLPDDSVFRLGEELLYKRRMGEIAEIIAHLDYNPFPPLYHILLNLWGKCFGTDLVVYRAFSLSAMLLSIALWAFFVFPLLPPARILIFLALYAGATSSLYFAQEVKANALFNGLCALMLLGYRNYRSRPGQGSFILLLGSAILSIYTYYFAWLIVIVIGGYLYIKDREKRAAILFFSFTLASFCPWITIFIEQMSHLGRLHFSGDHDFVELGSHLFYLPFLATLTRHSQALFPVSIIILAIVLIWIPIVYAIFRQRHTIIAWLFIVPVILLASVDLFGHAGFLAYTRYVFFLLPVILLLLSVSLNSGVIFGLSGLVAISCFFASTHYFNQDHKNQEIERASVFIGEHYHPSDLLLLVSPEQNDWVPRYFLEALNYYRPLIGKDILIATGEYGPELVRGRNLIVAVSKSFIVTKGSAEIPQLRKIYPLVKRFREGLFNGIGLIQILDLIGPQGEQYQGGNRR